MPVSKVGCYTGLASVKFISITVLVFGQFFQQLVSSAVASVLWSNIMIDSRNFVLRLWRILVAMGMASSLGLASVSVLFLR